MPRKISPLNQSAATVRTAAAAEKARKAASKQALKAAREQAASTQAAEQPAPPVVQAPASQADNTARDLAFLDTLKADAIASGALTDADVAAYVREQGVDPATGAPLPQAKTPYMGPMVALKSARISYVKAANGILCNGSPLALLCGQYSRPVVVKALIAALRLPNNPYAHLNPGQQSMNLRNKARHQLAEGTLLLSTIEAELKAEAVIAGAK